VCLTCNGCVHYPGRYNSCSAISASAPVFWCHALIPPLSNAAFLRNIRATRKSLSSQSLVTYPAALAAAKSCGTLRTASITRDWGMSGPQPHHCSMRRQARSELRVVPELNRTASPPGSRRRGRSLRARRLQRGPTNICDDVLYSSVESYLTFDVTTAS